MAARGGAIRAGRAFVELFAEDHKLVRGLRRASARLKAFGNHVRNIGLKIAMAGAAMMAPLLLATKLFARLGDDIGKMAQRTGLGTEALSRFRFVASQMGIDLAAMENGFRRMQRSIYDAGRGLSTAVDGLADLGLRFEDLDGLAPEEQFKIIAEALYRIKDPTTKAAIAMTLLGRSGTALLPMFAKGRKGIEELEEEARRLFLEMKEEDVQAAVKLTDAFDALWKVVRMGAFLVGAALAKKLTALIEQVTEVAVKINKWIDQNRELIITVMKVAAVILAAGVALMTLGVGITAIGLVLGGLASIIAGVGTAFGVVIAVLGFLLSPIGLAIVGILALGAGILGITGAGGKALDWLKRKFVQLKDEVVRVCGGIVDALVAGDVGLAAKIMWLTLKREWIRGTNFLKRIWLKFKHFFIQTGYNTWIGLLAVVETVCYGLVIAWQEVSAFLEKVWISFVVVWADVWDDMKATAKKAWTWIKGVFTGATAEVQKQTYAKIEEERAKAKAQRAEEYAAKFATREEKRQHDRERSERVHNAVMKGLAGDILAMRKKHQGELLGIDQDMIDAEDELTAAIEEARKKRAAKEETKEKRAKKKPERDVARTVEAVKVQVLGTFLHAKLLGRMGEASDKEIADATKETAKNTKQMLDELRNMETLVFES